MTQKANSYTFPGIIYNIQQKNKVQNPTVYSELQLAANDAVSRKLYMDKHGILTTEMIKALLLDLGGIAVDGIIGNQTRRAMMNRYGTNDPITAYKKFQDDNLWLREDLRLKESDGEVNIRPGVDWRLDENGNPVASRTQDRLDANVENAKLANDKEYKALQKRALERGDLQYQSADQYLDLLLNEAINVPNYKDYIYYPTVEYANEWLLATPYELPIISPFRDPNTYVRGKVPYKQEVVTGTPPDLDVEVKLHSPYAEMKLKWELMRDEKEARTKLKTQVKNDALYGAGNWTFDSNGNLVVRRTAPAASENAFQVPEVWDRRVTDLSVKGNLYDLGDSAWMAKHFGTTTGFREGSILTGNYMSVPLDLSGEEDLLSARTKAMASGNRRFLWNGKLYSTTSYTPQTSDYLQAVYDLEFAEKAYGKDSKQAQEARMQINRAQEAWMEDEFKRFGIYTSAMNNGESAGYPVARNWNIADNTSLNGYGHGIRRFLDGADGYVDLMDGLDASVFPDFSSASGLMNTARGAWDTLMGRGLMTGKVDRTGSPDRVFLFNMGHSKPLSPQFVKQYGSDIIDSDLTPVYARGNTNMNQYALRVDGLTRFLANPDGVWQYNKSGTYSIPGTQIYGTLWNNNLYFDPIGQDGNLSNIFFHHDKNDYGFGPNSSIGYGGYSGINTIARLHSGLIGSMTNSLAQYMSQTDDRIKLIQENKNLTDGLKASMIAELKKYNGLINLELINRIRRQRGFEDMTEEEYIRQINGLPANFKRLYYNPNQ